MDLNGNLYLVGFMGAGKSTVGRVLAKRLEREFLDTDRLIEEDEGKSISIIFDTKGEAFFREREEKVIKRIAGTSEFVVALGGGATMRENNRKRLASSGVTVYLAWPPEQLLERIVNGRRRPLVSSLPHSSRRHRLMELFESREAFYKCADFVVNCSNDKTVHQVV
ncbi:MAG: shikimate kinase, partial [bacterium]